MAMPQRKCVTVVYGEPKLSATFTMAGSDSESGSDDAKAIREEGNEAAHEAKESGVAEGVLSLQEESQDRDTMTVIFTTYYGRNPEEGHF